MSTVAEDVGRVAGLARRSARRAPMETVVEGVAATGGGLEGDHKGLKFPRRGLTLLAIEDWEAAVAALADLAGPVPLDWTARRANVLVQGLALPRSKGAILRLGAVTVTVTGQTVPCRRMDEAHPGLLKALYPNWRGGLTVQVTQGGVLRVGDPVSVVFAPASREVRLPG